MPPLIILGFGNMGAAIVSGALRAGVLRPEAVVIADPSPDRRNEAAALGLAAFPDASEALRAAPSSAAILLAIKPQMLAAVAPTLAPLGDRPLISILAGTPIARLTEALGTASIIRAMPNTPALIGHGLTALTPASRPEDDALARSLFQSVGDVVTLDESLFDAFTALAASGPAYLFHLAQAMADAGTRMGFDAAQSLDIVRATLSGSAELLARSPDPPETLRARVTSPGGTTAAAIAILESRAVRDAIADAVIAARDRACELGHGSGSA